MRGKNPCASAAREPSCRRWRRLPPRQPQSRLRPLAPCRSRHPGRRQDRASDQDLGHQVPGLLGFPGLGHTLLRVRHRVVPGNRNRYLSRDRSGRSGGGNQGTLLRRGLQRFEPVRLVELLRGRAAVPLRRRQRLKPPPKGGKSAPSREFPVYGITTTPTWKHGCHPGGGSAWCGWHPTVCWLA